MTRLQHALITVGPSGAGAAAFAALIATRPAATTRPAEAQRPRVRVIEVRHSAARLDIVSQGTVVPKAETTIVPQVAGKVSRLAPALAEGAFFGAGELLLEIDPSDHRLAVVQAEANVARAEARVALEEGEAAVARSEWTRLGSGQAPEPLVLREPQLRDARAALAGARASLEQASLALRRTRVVAPYAGRVQEKLVDVGQLVGPGTPVARIYAIDAAEVSLPIPVSELAYLDLPAGALEEGAGPEVRFHADYAGRRRAWTGRVVRRSGRIDPRTQMVHLIARIDSPYDPDAHEIPLETGLFVHAEIAGREEQAVVELPREALRGEARVHVVEDGRLRFRAVELLRLEPERVLVRGGLDEGELVCLSQLRAAVDGMQVDVDDRFGDAS